jgi:NAD(P)-dependent dehydrogenase (short-subunit alcohol dehydrogenase family)
VEVADLVRPDDPRSDRTKTPRYPEARPECDRDGRSTTLSREDWNTGRREKLIAATPAGRIPSPEEIAAAALYLATDDAAHMIGSYVIADGGYNMIGA